MGLDHRLVQNPKLGSSKGRLALHKQCLERESEVLAHRLDQTMIKALLCHGRGRCCLRAREPWEQATDRGARDTADSDGHAGNRRAPDRGGDLPRRGR